MDELQPGQETLTKEFQKLYVRSGVRSGAVYALPKRHWSRESLQTPIILPEGQPPRPDSYGVKT